MIKIGNTFETKTIAAGEKIECLYMDVKLGGVFELPGNTKVYQKISEKGEVFEASWLFDKKTRVLSTRENIKSGFLNQIECVKVCLI